MTIFSRFLSHFSVIFTIFMLSGIPAAPAEASPGCCAASQADPAAVQPKTDTPEPETNPKDPVGEILKKLNTAAAKLETYQADIRYLYIQEPDLLDSRTLRIGKIYYKTEDKHSRLRIGFDTLQQDDEDPRKHREIFVFDGVWLTRVDFPLEKIDLVQHAPEDEPLDVFEFIGRHFPLIGFTNIADLSKDFDISLCEEPSDPNVYCLDLAIPETSRYAKDYRRMRFEIDTRTNLPAKIIATSSQGDIYDIRLTEAILNKNIKNSIFSIETPPHFSKNMTPLQDRKD